MDWFMVGAAVGLMFTVSLSSCSEPTSVPSGLAGEWIEDVFPHRELTLSLRREYSLTSRQGVSYSTTFGAYDVSSDSIVLRPQRNVSRNTFGKVETTDLPPGTMGLHGAVELRADTLMLHYITAPFDAPIPTTMRLIRR